jgi:hypothetical protein
VIIRLITCIRLIPEEVAKASQKFLRDVYILPQLFAPLSAFKNMLHSTIVFFLITGDANVDRHVTYIDHTYTRTLY